MKKSKELIEFLKTVDRAGQVKVDFDGIWVSNWKVRGDFDHLYKGALLWASHRIQKRLQENYDEELAEMEAIEHAKPKG